LEAFKQFGKKSNGKIDRRQGGPWGGGAIIG
jgi:hypothetical protein